MTIEKYVKTLDPNHSYWLADDGDIERLNDVEPTAENLCIVFECHTCPGGYHAIPYTDLKIDNDGDYRVFYPEGDYKTWIFRDDVPEELQTLFNETDFENYVEPEDDDDDDNEYDDYDEDEEDTPAERMIKSGAGGVIRA